MGLEHVPFFETLNDYQKLATKTADYPMLGENMVYPALGCAEEAGEIAGKVKKLWRNLGIFSGKDARITAEQRDAIVKEMGDNLWYLAALANELGVDLKDVAKQNIIKLLDRKERGVIKSEGDTR